MGALTRVLSEEYKKSVELCYNILRSFLVSTCKERRQEPSRVFCTFHAESHFFFFRIELLKSCTYFCDFFF